MEKQDLVIPLQEPPQDSHEERPYPKISRWKLVSQASASEEGDSTPQEARVG